VMLYQLSHVRVFVLRGLYRRARPHSNGGGGKQTGAAT
jgi:hypothetical protein